VYLNRFSPTGFYSSAVANDFIRELQQREQRQIAYATKPEGELSVALPVGARGRPIYVSAEGKIAADQWIAQGFTEAMKTPDSTVIFVSKEKENEILVDQIECMGCLSACRFSNWLDHDDYNTGKKADPRSFCIQKTLQDAVHGDDLENDLMFSGHNAYKFAADPFYAGGFIPTVAQLVERIKNGD
jgi:nitronate monooxygenase